jgi:hypothetical protein
MLESRSTKQLCTCFGSATWPEPPCSAMGFGASAGIHTEKVLRLSLDLPLVIECVDAEEKIQAILPAIDQMIGGGLITLERAQVIVYRPDEPTK